MNKVGLRFSTDYSVLCFVTLAQCTVDRAENLCIWQVTFRSSEIGFLYENRYIIEALTLIV